MADKLPAKQPQQPAPPNEPVPQPGLRGEVFAHFEQRQVTIRFPFLPPEVLAEYKKLGIEPQKLLDMVHGATQHRENMERDVLRMEDGDRIEKNRTARRGQTFAFSLGMAAIAATVIGFFVAPEHASAIATVVGPTGLAALVVALLGVRWINKKQVNDAHDNEMVKLRGKVERLERVPPPTAD